MARVPRCRARQRGPDSLRGGEVIRDVVVKDAGRKGKGVFALRDFRKGEFIFRRRHARIVLNMNLGSLSAEDRRHLCELDYERSAVLLPPGCYLNHACDPNAMRSGVKVFAWRRIRRGEEITIDCRLNAFGGRGLLLRKQRLPRDDRQQLLLP